MANLISWICSIHTHLNHNHSRESPEVSKLFRHFKSIDVLSVLQQVIWAFNVIHCRSLEIVSPLGIKYLYLLLHIPPGSGLPPPEGPNAFLVFPSKPFSRKQPKWSFKNTYLFLSLIYLHCSLLHESDVQSPHCDLQGLTCPAPAPLSLPPSPQHSCPDSPARLA